MNQPKCQICGRALENLDSINRGVGPECLAKREKFLAAAGSNDHEIAMLALCSDPTVLRWIGMIGKAVGSGRQDHVFERENVLGETLYTLDFYVAAHKLGIEVDGSIHDKGKPDEAKRIQHAERKAALCRCMGIKLIRIHHIELRLDDLSGVIAKIEEITGTMRGSGNEAGSEPALRVNLQLAGRRSPESDGRPDF